MMASCYRSGILPILRKQLVAGGSSDVHLWGHAEVIERRHGEGEKSAQAAAEGRPTGCRIPTTFREARVGAASSCSRACDAVVREGPGWRTEAPFPRARFG